MTKVKNIVISGTNFWNPGDDFVRDGVIRILKELFPDNVLNFLFYNFNQDYFPQSKFSGIHNMVAKNDLKMYSDSIDYVVIAGLSAGNEIKDLYNWVIENGLQDRVYLIGAGYENSYVDKYIYEEPELTIFKNARIITGRTAKKPKIISDLNLNYHHINCPALLSVKDIKEISEEKKIEKIAFSIQLPHEIGIPNHCCDKSMYLTAVKVLTELAEDYEIDLIAHHKSEYFHFLNLFKQYNAKVPVIFSSYYQDLFDVYPNYDLVVTTRLHSSLFANGFGIPGIILNDTDRHTHCLEGFPNSVWVDNKEKFYEALSSFNNQSLRSIAHESEKFKENLLKEYITLLKPYFISEESENQEDVSKKKLNVGCGSDYREGFINIDGNKDLKVDHVIDIKPGSLIEYFGTSSFGHILAKDFVEHHFHWEANQLLTDFYNLLSTGGYLEIILPNIENIINAQIPIEEKKLWLYGGQDITQNWETDSPDLDRKKYPEYFCHKFGWTKDSMAKELENIGFKNIQFEDLGWNMRLVSEKTAYN